LGVDGSLWKGVFQDFLAEPSTDAGRFDIVVQTLIETMMTGNVVLFAAFFV
jgi:hypothetical protein